MKTKGTAARAALSESPSAAGGAPPLSVLRNVQTIADLEAKSDSDRGLLNRLSDRVSRFASSPPFLVLHLLWFAGWITWNRMVGTPLDPYPFTFLTFLVSLEAIFLTSFVLISQNHLEAQAHRRAALDLQINLLAEREMTSVLRAVMAIATHLGVADACSDEDLQQLIEQTDVNAVASTVEEMTESQRNSS